MNHIYIRRFTSLTVTEEQITMDFDDNIRMAHYNEDRFSWEVSPSLLFEKLHHMKEVLDEKVAGQVKIDKEIVEKELFIAFQKDVQPFLEEFKQHLTQWKENILEFSLAIFTEDAYNNTVQAAVNEINLFLESPLVSFLKIDTDDFTTLRKEFTALFTLTQNCPEIYQGLLKIDKKLSEIPGNDEGVKKMRDVFEHNYQMIVVVKVKDGANFPESINLSKENIQHLLSVKEDSYSSLFEKISQ